MKLTSLLTNYPGAEGYGFSCLAFVHLWSYPAVGVDV